MSNNYTRKINIDIKFFRTGYIVITLWLNSGVNEKSLGTISGDKTLSRAKVGRNF